MTKRRSRATAASIARLERVREASLRLVLPASGATTGERVAAREAARRVDERLAAIESVVVYARREPINAGRCMDATCPGVGEVLYRCQNPGHGELFGSTEGFHRQRRESPDRRHGWHGATRRGHPRTTFCSSRCERWYEEHVAQGNGYDVPYIGRGRKTWTRVTDTTGWDVYALRRATGQPYGLIGHAINGLRALVARGVLPRGSRVGTELLRAEYIEQVHVSLDMPVGDDGMVLGDLIELRAEPPAMRDERGDFLTWLSEHLPEGARRLLARMPWLHRGRPRAAITYAFALRHEYPHVYARYLREVAHAPEPVVDGWLAYELRPLLLGAGVPEGWVSIERIDPAVEVAAEIEEPT